MNPARKAELTRRALMKEAAEADFDLNFTRQIVDIAREMSWTIDYIMQMGITQYVEVRNALKYSYDEQNKALKQREMVKTFSG